MTKIKELKNKSNRKANITVKSLMSDVRKKLNNKKVDAVMSLLEEKVEELDAAKYVVKTIEKQIKKLENTDINDIDTRDLEYEED
jgi:hypothetical protein